MCGICGLIDLTGHHRADPQTVRRMTDLIRHRGPDGDGFYDAPDVSMGMRRLSIIDVAGSDQPLYNEDRSIALVFNGEIYNYRELRDDLIKRGHQPHTAGDGETIIHLYEEHGLDLFRHLRGMYGFALWDSNTNRLVLAVDHIGMKPLYLHERDGRLLFASEVKALFADSGVPRGLNLDVLDTYLGFGYMIGPETLFEGVRRLPPGHALVAEQGQTRLHRYWDFPEYVSGESGRGDTSIARHAGLRPYNGSDGGEIITRAHDLLTESVHLHLRSDVPLGLFLSGGIDSAAMLGLMAQEAGGRIKSFTIGYDMRTPDNELEYARRIAHHFHTDHHERVINAEDWWNGLLRYVYAHDEPNANPSAVSLLLLSEETARHVKVVLTGLGGDELFGGYPHHHNIPQLLRHQTAWGRWLSPMQTVMSALEPYYPAMKRYRIIGALPTYLPRIQQALLPRDEGLMRRQSFDGMVFSDALRHQLYGPDLHAAWQTAQHRQRTYSHILEQSWRDDPYDTAMALVINTWLTGNALLSQDKTAMAHALEARVPLFDPNLLRFAAQVPPALRMKSNKYVLREAVRPCLPDFALNRPKQPFGTPIMQWFEGDLSSRIQDVLRDPGANLRGLFDSAGLDRLLDDHFSGRARHTEVIFRLLLLELWQREFLRG
ncbi:MAG: asparagine synthase (glutamine-hydrolyzing) [Anaerolineaceae bacterium]|nr:asparagine synthase (glutamine-hydrolyzing) [Anaerolineaceae bacterium]